MHLIGFHLRESKQERKSARKRPMYYTSQDAQSSVYSKWAAIQCSRWNLSTSVPCGGIHVLQKSKQRGWYSDSESKRSYTWALLLRGKNGSFQRSQSFLFESVFVSILVCGHEPRVTTKRMLSQEQVREMGFLRRVQGVTHRDKMHRFEIRKARNVTPLLRIKRSQLIGSAMCPESTRKDWRGTSCWLHRRESNREVQGSGGVTTSPTLLGPVLVWTEGNYLRLLLIVRYFGST